MTHLEIFDTPSSKYCMLLNVGTPGKNLFFLLSKQHYGTVLLGRIFVRMYRYSKLFPMLFIFKKSFLSV